MNELKCFKVGEYDYVAAYDREGALNLMVEMCGADAYPREDFLDEGIEEVSDKVLDTPWVDEDDTSIVVGTLRGWLAEVTEPTWLAGTE